MPTGATCQRAMDRSAPQRSNRGAEPGNMGARMKRKKLRRTPTAPAGPAPEAAHREGNAASPVPPTTEGAVGASVAGFGAPAILEIDAFEIEAGGVRDRLEHDDEDHVRLMDSLREYGQQVPVLVRPHPDGDGRYQIVYGRRRVLALRDLGVPVMALVRDLDDASLVLAQGQGTPPGATSRSSRRPTSPARWPRPGTPARSSATLSRPTRR